MNGSLLAGLAAIGAAVVLLIVSGFAYVRKRRRSCRSKLDELVRQMIPVNDQAILTVALDAVEPSGQMRSDSDRRALDRKQIWKLLDGMDGICCMETNSRVLVQIADHLERCHPKAAEAAEEVRLEARCLGWHTKWLHEAEKNNCLESHFHTYGQNAAASYYNIMRKTVVLFQRSHISSEQVRHQ